MNAAHFHLLITHLPIFASVFGALLLVWGLFKDSRESRQAAYVMLIMAAFGAIAANISGEEAEHAVEELPGVFESLIEEHEESVSLVLWMLIPCGLLSVAGIWASFRKQELEKKLAYMALVLSLLGFAATSRTAWLGGQIRHTEIRSGAAPARNNADAETGDKD